VTAATAAELEYLTITGNAISPDATGVTAYDYELTRTGAQVVIKRLVSPLTQMTVNLVFTVILMLVIVF
jgi:hypothetical protein